MLLLKYYEKIEENLKEVLVLSMEKVKIIMFLIAFGIPMAYIGSSFYIWVVNGVHKIM